MRVLVVDDCSDLREVLAELLRMEGYDVLEAGSAASALELARSMAFGAAVVDYNLGDLSGEMLAEQLRQLQKLRVVAMTGDMALKPAKVFDAMLRKPFSPDDVAKLLRTLLDGHRAA